MFTNRVLNYRKTSTQTNIENLISPYLASVKRTSIDENKNIHETGRAKKNLQRKFLQEMWGNIYLLSLLSDIIVVSRGLKDR